jgi:pimeloyl-ACP methyl ester carboxylesterase
MTSLSVAWTEETLQVAGVDLHLRKGGSGEPLLILSDEIGHVGALRYQEELAQNHTVYVPAHPGFGQTPRLDWVMNMRDLAGWYLMALDELGLRSVNTIGCSLGGWLAAEMATMNPGQFRKLALVGPMGILPPEGYIYDVFLEVAKQCISTAFLNPEGTPEFQELCPEEPTPEQAMAWEVAREEACRLGWKPYMYYPGLPHLLARLKDLPTLVIWGREDAIVPVSAAAVYHESIPGSRLEIMANCGHMPQIEKAGQFLALVGDFFA